jgi:hypothetical protein
VPTDAATSDAERAVALPRREAVTSRRVSPLIPLGGAAEVGLVRSTPSIESTSS